MGRPPLPIGTWGDIAVTNQGGSWRASARYRGHDGITRSYSRYRPTKHAAKQALLNHFATINATTGTGELTGDSTVAELMTVWLARWESVKPRRDATKTTYRRAVELVTRRIPGVRLREITTGRLDAVVDGVAATAPETARQVRNVLRQAFAEAVRVDALGVNPALGVPAVHKEAGLVEVLTGQEVVRLRQAARKWEGLPVRHDRPYPARRIAAALDVLLGTGMRIGELLALTWDDIDLDAVPAVIEVAGTLTRDADTRQLYRQGLPKTDRSERELYLPAFTTASLRKWREEASPHTQIVFPGATGKWRDGSSFRKHLNEVASLAGLGRVNPHKLRRTVATAVYRAESLQHAGAQLGHSELGVTSKHYVARSNKGPVEVVGILDELVTAEL